MYIRNSVYGVVWEREGGVGIFGWVHARRDKMLCKRLPRVTAYRSSLINRTLGMLGPREGNSLKSTATVKIKKYIYSIKNKLVRLKLSVSFQIL